MKHPGNGAILLGLLTIYFWIANGWFHIKHFYHTVNVASSSNDRITHSIWLHEWGEKLPLTKDDHISEMNC